MLKTASDVRQFTLQALTRKKPELLTLSIKQLHELADDTDRIIEDCGPFDPAAQRFIELSILYHRLAFLKDAEDRNLARNHELALSRFVPALGWNIIGLTAEECLNLAEHHEEAAEKAGLLTPKGARCIRRVNAYIELAAVKEGYERNLSLAA